MPGRKTSALSSSYASELASNDLFPVVKVGGTPSSPYNEIKWMESDELSSFITGLVSGSVSGLGDSVTQVGHGFSVGDVIRHEGGQFVLASPDDFTLAEGVGIVYSVPSADNFLYAIGGNATLDGVSSIIPGQLYFLSGSGQLTTIDPATENTGQQSKPVAIGRTASSVFVINQRSLSPTTFFKVLSLSDAPLRYTNGLELYPTHSVSCYSEMVPSQLIGTDDFSVFFVAKLPPIEFAPRYADQVLFALGPNKETPASISDGFIVTLNPTPSGADLAFKINSGTGIRSVVYKEVLAAYGNSIVSIAFVRNSASDTGRIFINGELVSTEEVSFGFPDSWATSYVNNTYFSVNRNTDIAAELSGFSVYCFYLYNKVLSATEVRSNHLYGIDGDDKWGSTTATGSVFALEPESVQPGVSQWRDVSPYRTHLVRPETGSATLRPITDFVLDYSLTASGYFGEKGIPRDILPDGAIITSYRFLSSQNITASLGSAPNDSSRLAPINLQSGSITTIAMAGYLLPQKRVYLTAPGLSSSLQVSMEGYVSDEAGVSLTTPFTEFVFNSFGATGVSENTGNDKLIVGFVLGNGSNRTLKFTTTKTTPGSWSSFTGSLYRNGVFYMDSMTGPASTYSHTVSGLDDAVYTYLTSIGNSYGDRDTVSILVETVGISTGEFSNCSVRCKVDSSHPITLTPTGSFFNTPVIATFDDITNGIRTTSSIYDFRLNSSSISNQYDSNISGQSVEFAGYFNSGSNIIGVIQVQTTPFGSPFSGLTTCD
jgi:hypothetical protein